MILDLENVSDSNVMPMGEYVATVSDVEIKTSKNGDDYLALTFNTSSGNLWENFNVWHSAEKTRNFSLSFLKKLLSAANVKLKFESKEDLRDSLLGAKVLVQVGHKTDEFGTKAKINGYKPAGLAGNYAPVSDPNMIPF